MSSALMYVAGVLLFAVGVAASIGLHEIGHLIPGKLYNVKITQYFVGFGRTIWSRRRGETEYGLKAIPLGGYVKLVGMLPPAPDQDPEKVRASNTGMFAQLVSDARAAEYEHVDPDDHDRLFYRLPWWKRVVIMGSGRDDQPGARVAALRCGLHGLRRHRGHDHGRQRLAVREGRGDRPRPGTLHARTTRSRRR